jgi:hypothetical protein
MADTSIGDQIIDRHLRHAAAAQIAVDREVEHGAVAQAAFMFEEEADCPDVFRLQGLFGAQHFARIPSGAIVKGWFVSSMSHNRSPTGRKARQRHLVLPPRIT